MTKTELLKGTIRGLATYDIRFPTSLELDGSDAMNPDPDYSAAYVVLETDRGDGVEGHGLAFTIGRGNDVVVAAIEVLRPMIVGHAIADFVESPGAFCRRLTGDSQLRWLGPEKGVMHMATAAVINALWDLYAKLIGKPLWKLLTDLSPAQIVELVDFRYLTDALTPDQALDILDRQLASRPQREADMRAHGYPAYTTSAGWLGYPDEKVRRLCREGMDAGFKGFKIKVGLDQADDIRRAKIVRETIGPDRTLMVDANQRWDVPVAIQWTSALAFAKPLWIEEPTCPDDVLGHAAVAQAMKVHGIGVATGEHCPNRVVFKQLLQAKAIAFCQIDFCRLAGVNEVVAVLLLAAKFGVPVCPHAGGVGLCEYVQHASIFDYIAVSGSLEGRWIEYVDHLHEHFVDPCVIRDGRYVAPLASGSSITMKTPSRLAHLFPSGTVWKELASR
jgi:L-fuconate dehydratase